MIHILFPIRVKELRTAAGLTQTQLADALNLKRCNINSIERAGNFPKPDTFVAIAEYFNVSTDYLLGRTNNPVFHPDNSVLANNPLESAWSNFIEKVYGLDYQARANFTTAGDPSSEEAKES